MASIRFRAIRPKGMNIGQYQRRIDNALKLEQQKIEGLYKNVSQGFSSGTVNYEKKGPEGLGERKIIVKTSDIRMVSLDKGTRIRWAVMSSDFRAKTTHRRLSSRGGSGGAIIRGRSAMQARNIRPRPGIRPREFSEEIARVRQKPFGEQVQRSINSAAKDTF